MRRQARRLDAGDSEAIAPVSRTRRVKELQDTLTALFTVWDAPVLRAVLCAAARHIAACAAVAPEEEAHIMGALFPLPADACLGDGAATETWMAALWRLGNPTLALPERGTPECARYETWARALLLGALWMSMAVRDLLFVDARELWMRLHARTPSLLKTRAFLMPGLRDALDAFAEGGYTDPDAFVARCEGHWMYGFAPDTVFPDDV